MTPTSAQMPVLAQANLLGVMCGHGIDGCADQIRDLVSRHPIDLTDGMADAIRSGYHTTAPGGVRRHLKAVG